MSDNIDWFVDSNMGLHSNLFDPRINTWRITDDKSTKMKYILILCIHHVHHHATSVLEQKKEKSQDYDYDSKVKAITLKRHVWCYTYVGYCHDSKAWLSGSKKGNRRCCSEDRCAYELHVCYTNRMCLKCHTQIIHSLPPYQTMTSLNKQNTIWSRRYGVWRVQSEKDG